jgi:hypothetical protein
MNYFILIVCMLKCFKNLRLHEFHIHMLPELKKVEVSSVTDPVCVQTVQCTLDKSLGDTI